MLRSKFYIKRVVGLAVLCCVSLVVVFSSRRVFAKSVVDKSPKELPPLKQENQADDVLHPDYAFVVDGKKNPDQIDDTKGAIDSVSFGEMEDSKEYDLTRGNRVLGKVSKYYNSQFSAFQTPIDPKVRENAVFLSVVSNKDFKGILESIEAVESRFNHKYQYDWVFFNDQPFTDHFKSSVTNLVSGKVSFVEIPLDQWMTPEWVDLSKLESRKEEMKKLHIKHADSDAFRHKNRFLSGFFFNHPAMKPYKYYWRIEPNIRIKCDLFETDWFRYMRENNKRYAFALAPLEIHKTVKNLWKYTRTFMDENPQLINGNNALEFITEDDGEHFNMCHFWSTFEIGDLDFFRLDSYMKFFDHLDHSGGFYYSRWSDSPIHTIAVTMLLLRLEIFHLSDSGYSNDPVFDFDCPNSLEIRQSKRCTCNPKGDHTWAVWSCVPKWYEMNEIEKPSHADFEFVNKFKPEDHSDDEEW